jgi:predicted NodU family carbamoyl transferase
VAAHLTTAQARKLGLLDEARAKRTTRRAAPGPYHTVCVLCREEFRTRAAEDRHVDETQHPRYALVAERQAVRPP